jgi:nicotinamidase-related amidase
MPPLDVSHNRAIVCIDLQNDTVRAAIPNASERAEFTARVNALVSNGRWAGLPVIFVTTEFRTGYPCVPKQNTGLTRLASKGLLRAGSAGAALADGLESTPSDLMSTKRRASMFVHCDAPALLSGLAVQHLIVAGVSTSGCVLSTVRHGADLDFSFTVVADCCADADGEVHRLLCEKVFPSQADVVTCAELRAGPGTSASGGL